MIWDDRLEELGEQEEREWLLWNLTNVDLHLCEQ